MSNIAIKIENVSKQYRLGEVGTGSLSHDINRWWHLVRGKENPYLKVGDFNNKSTQSTSGYVWALKGIDFEVNKGSVLGIIGKNGAGKSTLLKLLSKVTAPTTGNIKMKGRIASLLEVGTGFHLDLTGRENIYLNGTILGMTRAEVSEKIDTIVDFAGIARYLDTPVKRYSSGMTVRLGFAVAAHLEPEILIVDEVLAVGDYEFQNKAVKKMKEVSQKENRTILFVSHNMASIRRLCESLVVLHNGEIAFMGGVEEGISFYLENNQAAVNLSKVKDNKYVALKAIEMLDDSNTPKTTFDTATPLRVVVKLQIKESIRNTRIVIQVVNQEEFVIFKVSNQDYMKPELEVGTYEFSCTIPANILKAGDYRVRLGYNLNDKKQILPYIDCYSFNVIDSRNQAFHFKKKFSKGLIAPNVEWETKSI